MQLSDDKFDELLKRAAKDYPLKTGAGDWDSVYPRLSKNTPEKAKKNRKWAYATLLLLLLAGAFFVIADYSNKSSGKKAPALHQQKAVRGDQAKDNTDVRQPQTGTAVSGDKVNDHPAAIAQNSEQAGMPLHNNSNNNNIINSESNGSLPDKEPLLLAQIQTQTQTQKSDQTSSNQPNISAKEGVVHVDAGIKTLDKADGNNNIVGKDDLNKKQAALTVPIKLSTSPKTLYGSFFAGPQLSTVKFQQGDNVGYRIGIALGYRINNRLNAELAVQRESKSFYSHGQYFDRSKPHSIETLNGDATITDIPVSVRYNFHEGNRGQFFAAAGVSAISITHTEKYEYVVTKNGTPKNLSRSYGSSSSTKYFSNINASVGYEIPVGSSFRLKAEPYYQTYIQGFGVGDLPLSSFGLNLGVVKDLK